MSSSSTNCRRCGKCCLTNFTAYVTEEDVSRWRRENRQDILGVIERDRLIWVGDHMVSADDGHYATGCPFLIPTDEHWLCSIYETRPNTCRAYEPGSSELCAQWKQPAAGTEGELCRGSLNENERRFDMPQIKMYTLSTCSHCKAAKRFLQDCQAPFDFTDVDLLEGEEKQLVLNEVIRFNPHRSFPTILIGDKVIIGFNEKAIREALGL